MTKRRKQLIIVVGVASLLVGIAILITVLSNRDDTDADLSPIDIVGTTSQQTVTIEDADSEGLTIDSIKLREIGDSLYSMVAKYTKNPADTYTAQVRSGSLQTSYAPYDGEDVNAGIPRVAFIVDIPDAKQSYTITRSGGENYPYDIVHILCLPSEKLKYGNFGCVDAEQ